MDRPHQREVDEEAAVADRVTGDVVAAAAHSEEKLRVPRELDRIDDIGRALAAGDNCRAAVDHRVPDGTGGFVSVLAWQGESPAHLAAQARQNFLGMILAAS